jgi:hypothetical protein
MPDVLSGVPVDDVTGELPALEARDDPGVDDADPVTDTELDPEPDEDVVEVDTEFDPEPPDEDPEIGPGFDPESAGEEPEKGVPEVDPPPPGSPVIDGPTVEVAVG